MARVTLYHFSASEFREWWPLMSPRLLTMLDLLRFRLGRGIEISPHPRALGRRLGPGKMSEHNVDEWGEVLAVDAFVSGINSPELARVVTVEATRLGFTGIGVYPEWTNPDGVRQVGFHLGVRPNRQMGAPATWGYVGGEMVSMKAALAAIGSGDND